MVINVGFECRSEREIKLSPEILYRAWTEKLDHWFAAPGTVVMTPEINVPFFFQTEFQNKFHPHYGRFIKLQPYELIEMTWVTSGTLGAETRVTIEFIKRGGATLLRLKHGGFSDEDAMIRHEEAWPHVLNQLEKKMSDSP